MSVFAYSAVDMNAALVRGTLAADSPRQAREQLRARGLTVQEMHDQLATASKVWVPWRRTGRHATKLAALIRELATLVGAGIQITQALDTLAGQYRGDFRNAVLLLRDGVSSGRSLAECMGEQPETFDALCVHMVEVGENSGNLDEVLDQLASFNERYLELKDRVVTALLYPALVLFLSVGVAIFLMTVVVPMLLDNLLEAGQQLPWPTRILKTASDVLTHHGPIFAIVCVLGAVALGSVLRTSRGRKAWHRCLLRLPVFGVMSRKQGIARVALIVSTLMKSGIVFLSAIEIAARSTKNLVLRDSLKQTQADVAAGRDIGEAMERTGAFPAMVIQIFTVGQQSGKLEEMLERLAIDYDRQVTTMSTRLATALEPILIVFLAVFVGFILFATILPILEAGNVL
jgi:type II secretory pathway component PulF